MTILEFQELLISTDCFRPFIRGVINWEGYDIETGWVNSRHKYSLRIQIEINEHTDGSYWADFMWGGFELVASERLDSNFTTQKFVDIVSGYIDNNPEWAIFLKSWNRESKIDHIIF